MVVTTLCKFSVMENIIMSEENTNVTKKIGDTLSQSEIVKVMAELNANSETPISYADLRTAVELFKAAVIQEVGRGHKVQLNGFVSFVPSYRPPRKGNNVITKEPLSIPEGVQVTAKVGSLLRKAVKTLDNEAIQIFKSLKNPPSAE